MERYCFSVVAIDTAYSRNLEQEWHVDLNRSKALRPLPHALCLTFVCG